jgi:hypothetical protein
VLKQGKRTIDEYYKEMELLLVRAEIREDLESKMARFLGGLNEEIAGFVEMFPYHSLCKILLIKLSAQRENSARGTWEISFQSFYCCPVA